MTIETKIAKNGSKRYYVRDEKGKLTQISSEKAQALTRKTTDPEADKQRAREAYIKNMAEAPAINAALKEVITAENEMHAIDDYAVTVEAQEVAIETETELASTETKAEVAEVEVKSDRLTELKAKKANLSKAIRNALKGHYINNNGEFIAADDAGYTTIGLEAMNPAYEKLYCLDNGEYVEVADNAIKAFTFLELMFDSICDALQTEIARNAVKFEAGKWYVSDETDWDGNLADCRYLILKRTKSYVTIYNPEQDGWGYLDNYDANDEIEDEFDCIFRKKIQFDERGEYVDWENENGELVTLFAANETEPPTNDDDNDKEDNEETDNGEDNANVEVENNVEVEEDEPKFEASKTYYINDENGKPYTLKVESRTAKYLVGTTANGTNKYYVHDTFRGEYVDTKLTDEFGNREVIWAAHEYKPEVKAETALVPAEFYKKHEIKLNTSKLDAQIARENGTFSADINGEFVTFENWAIVRIDAANKLGMLFRRNNGKKQFFTVATQCGRPIQGSTRAIAASKIADRYMAKETAKEQDKFFHNFFDAHKTETGKFFTVIAEIVYADGYDHTFERQFDYFNQAQEFVGEVKEITGDNPTEIIIKRNEQCGKIFYHRKADGTETYDLPNTEFFKTFSPTDIQIRLNHINKAHKANDSFCYDLNHGKYNPANDAILQNLREANANLRKTRNYYEFILHETEPTKLVEGVEITHLLDRTYDNRRFKAGNETLTFVGGVLSMIYSERYGLWLRDTQTGNQWWQLPDVDKRFSNEEFFAELARRGACTIDQPNDDPPPEPSEIEQIEKRMSEITKERDELYDALEEAEADDEISQQWIDYLEEELEKLLAEYNELWARLAELKANQGKVA